MSENESEAKMYKLSICFKLMEEKFPKANLVDISFENKGWYRYKNENEIILIKYSTKKENPEWSFDSINELSKDEGISKLILAFTSDDNLSYIEIKAPSIKNDIFDNKPSHINYNKHKNKLMYCPHKVSKNLNETLPQPKINDDNVSLEKPNDIPEAIDRYKSLIKRNYQYIFHYLLYSLYVNNNSQDILDSKNLTALNKSWEEESEIYKLSDINPEVIKDFKKAYKSMNEVRQRNKFFHYFTGNKKLLSKEQIESLKHQGIEDFIEIVENYENIYNSYYQKNIMSFNAFKEVWDKDVEGNGSRTCAYCGITEKQIEKLIGDEDIPSQIKTKRLYSRGKTMEIDKIEADGEYEDENIVLSCYWCNNAKTDEFDIYEFKEIARGINKVWVDRLGQEIEFPIDIWKK